MGQGLVQGSIPPTGYAVVTDSAGNVYVGGIFRQALPGAPEANHLAKWDGNQWWSIAQGLDGTVYDLYIAGNKLYVAGNFAKAGWGGPGYPIDATNVAVWDGSSWQDLAGEDVILGMNVTAIAADAANGQVYIGGREDSGLEGVFQRNPATGQWSMVGEGLTAMPGDTAIVFDIQVTSNGAVIAGGYFAKAGATAPEANNLAVWNGQNWYSLAQSVVGDVRSLALDSADRLYVAGIFDEVRGPEPVYASGVARYIWQAPYWEPLQGTVITNP